MIGGARPPSLVASRPGYFTSFILNDLFFTFFSRNFVLNKIYGYEGRVEKKIAGNKAKPGSHRPRYLL